MESRKLAAGILMVDRQTGDILLDRRGPYGYYPNSWATFGGTYEEKDGHPKETAKREFKEETGINSHYKMSSTPIDIYKDNHVVFYTYLAFIDKKPTVKISDESTDYGWFNIDNLPNNLMPHFFVALQNALPIIKEEIYKNQFA